MRQLAAPFFFALFALSMARPVPSAPDPLQTAAAEYPAAAHAPWTLEPGRAEAALREGRSILLRTGPFDPSSEGAKSPASPLRGLVLAQFSRALSPADRASLEGPGLRFLDYLPNRAYLVRVSGHGSSLLSSHPALVWAGPWRPEWKVEPRLLAAPWGQPVLLDLRIFEGESPERVLSSLRALFPAVLPVSTHGAPERGVTLRVLVPAESVRDVALAAAGDDAVWTVEPWFLPHVMNDQSIWVIQSYDTVDKTNYAVSADIWNHGITGTGQTPAVCDTGVDDDACPFRLSSAGYEVTDAQFPPLPQTGTTTPARKVIAYYVLPGATPYDGYFTCSGGNLHGTHVAGSVLGDNYATLSTPTSGGHDPGDGMAPNARLIFQDAGKEDTGCLDGLANDYDLIFQQAYDAGARIHSNSWGNDTYGAYTGDCRTLDRFVYGREDMLFCFAAGNMGPWVASVGSPAAAKNVTAVGATTSGSIGANEVAIFSSRGPTADGRIKPDLCAPGWGIVSALGDTSHTDGGCGTTSKSGTSMATPTAAGGATLLREYFADGFYPGGTRNAPDAMNPSAALLKAALLCGAVDVPLASQAAELDSLTPNNDQGFGRILLDTVCAFPDSARKTRAWDRWNAQGLETGQVDAFPVQVVPGQPLKAALCWTDPEASGASAITLVNNLDLEAVAPDGTVYRGNVFSGGQSVPGGSADVLNNVEVIFVKTPAPGIWNLRVVAAQVPGTPSEAYSSRQGYALVATLGACVSSLSAPQNLTATDGPPSGVLLAWDAVPGAGRYQIYRASGGCGTAPGSFHLIGASDGPTFSDGFAEGGFTYAYRVRATDGCGEGPASACASVSYSGPCHLFPVFGGLATAVGDPQAPTCNIGLSWNPGSSSCPAGPSLVYNVYRGEDPYFSPGVGSLRVAGLGGTSYTDLDVASGVAYFYVVRAEDGTTGGPGPAHGGNEDTNSSWVAASAHGPSTATGTWTDDGGDTSLFMTMESPWTLTRQQNHTAGGRLSYHCAADGLTYPVNACAAVSTPEIPLLPGSPSLSYWVRYNLETMWDGVVVELSDDGGTTWNPIAPASGYPGTFGLTGAPPVNVCRYPASQGCFTGPSGNGALTQWAPFVHDLSPYAGQSIRLRWRLSSDPGTEYEGLYLDDIQVTNALVPQPCRTCQLACTAGAAPTSGGSPFEVSFSASATATDCSGTTTYAWDFGDGGTSSQQNPTYTYGTAGTYTWTVTISMGGISCTGRGEVLVPAYDLVLRDDRGASQVCLNSSTGAWTWAVLKGLGAGVYSGSSQVTRINGTLYFESGLSGPYRLSLRVLERYHKANGSLSAPAYRLRSVLFDSNTLDDPPQCP